MRLIENDTTGCDILNRFEIPYITSTEIDFWGSHSNFFFVVFKDFMIRSPHKHTFFLHSSFSEIPRVKAPVRPCLDYINDISISYPHHQFQQLFEPSTCPSFNLSFPFKSTCKTIRQYFTNFTINLDLKHQLFLWNRIREENTGTSMVRLQTLHEHPLLEALLTVRWKSLN